MPGLIILMRAFPLILFIILAFDYSQSYAGFSQTIVLVKFSWYPISQLRFLFKLFLNRRSIYLVQYYLYENFEITRWFKVLQKGYKRTLGSTIGHISLFLY